MRYKTIAVTMLVLGVCVLLFPAVAPAHHGTNISYDRTAPVTIKGVVKEFWYRNPHPALFIEVMDAGGTPTRWTIEIAPTPYTLALRGWSKRRSEEALKPGTPVTARIFAARAGTPVGLLQGMTNDEGVEIFGGDTDSPAR